MTAGDARFPIQRPPRLVSLPLPLSNAVKAQQLQQQALAAAADAVRDMFGPLAAAEQAVRSLDGLALVPQPIRDRARRLAGLIEIETEGLMHMASRQP